jgi:hypothetical protein
MNIVLKIGVRMCSPSLDQVQELAGVSSAESVESVMSFQKIVFGAEDGEFFGPTA